MGKTWILQTETKGTGAQMVPLEPAPRDTKPEPLHPPRKPQPRTPEGPAPRAPRRFRIVDLMTRETLLDDAGAAEVVAALQDVLITLDVQVSLWYDGRSRWRQLTLAEQRTLFEFSRA